MELNCHCGNIRISVSGPPETLTSCNCSICHRYGSLWGYYTPDETVITIGAAGAGGYLWGDECIEFMHCRKCGCLTHYQTLEGDSDPKVAANFRMAPRLEIESIRVRRFDGADTWQHLD